MTERENLPTADKAWNNWSTSVAIGDIDADGDLDAVVSSNGGQNGNEIWLNNGTGNFTHQKVLSFTYSCSLH